MGVNLRPRLNNVVSTQRISPKSTDSIKKKKTKSKMPLTTKSEVIKPTSSTSTTSASLRSTFQVTTDSSQSTSIPPTLPSNLTTKSSFNVNVTLAVKNKKNKKTNTQKYDNSDSKFRHHFGIHEGNSAPTKNATSAFVSPYPPYSQQNYSGNITVLSNNEINLKKENNRNENINTFNTGYSTFNLPIAKPNEESASDKGTPLINEENFNHFLMKNGLEGENVRFGNFNNDRVCIRNSHISAVDLNSDLKEELRRSYFSQEDGRSSRNFGTLKSSKTDHNESMLNKCRETEFSSGTLRSEDHIPNVPYNQDDVQNFKSKFDVGNYPTNDLENRDNEKLREEQMMRKNTISMILKMSGGT
ncbi:hypothetical protein HDU92_004907 [Lobulomyces angularis]|nr:hypothetical protein HDU92_004907 [Lobulomyces angularis]